MECTKLNCPMQAGTVTENCGKNCPWRTTAKTGDLISRAAAIERMKSMAGCATCENYKGVRCRACTWDDAVNIVDEVPAVDAAPVVHGYWINHIDDIFPEDSMIECSECHGHEYTRLLPDDNYCPNCGAKMNGEQKEAE